MIRSIMVSGFRGILSPLVIQFEKDKSPQSMVIYGRNGTGKSSITDAWEWIQTEKIEHLAREGARQSAYPHRLAQPGETYVEIDFVSKELGKIRLEYDQGRITKPKPTGNIDGFRSLTPHPCHVRFEDLVRFVYLTKSERYDALAQLMGFSPQVEVQKSLKRVYKKVEEHCEGLKEEEEAQKRDLAACLELRSITARAVLEEINSILKTYKIPPIRAIKQSEDSLNQLTALVSSDPSAKELALLEILEGALENLSDPTNFTSSISGLLEEAEKFKEMALETANLLLLDLYEQGEKILLKLQEGDEDFNVCPLCGQEFEGSLVEHISQKIVHLRQLKKSRDSFDTQRQKVLKAIPLKDSFLAPLGRIDNSQASFFKKYGYEEIKKQAEELGDALMVIRDLLSIKPEQFDAKVIRSIRRKLDGHVANYKAFSEEKSEVVTLLKDRIKILQDDAKRMKLVFDHRTILNVVDLWTAYSAAGIERRSLATVLNKFEEIIKNYIESSIFNVQSRFDVISTDVEKYFGILEQDSTGVGKPELKLLQDEDHAVELQVEFHGEPIFPAYRYLSESQLNSFGLALFLASAKFFNSKFPFLILDDVINSFDGYKRPKVIDLLTKEFTKHQILILTHDSAWSDRLFDTFSNWVKHRFTRLDPTSGPINSLGFPSLEIIRQLVDNDEPVRAGRNLGPYLERRLQELGEAFEMLVKYNQKNVYTLDPLLDRLRLRVKEKLGENHALYESIAALQDEAGFRNLCAHWKDPEIEVTAEEMNSVVTRWEEIENLVICQHDDCRGYLHYDGKGAFICRCGRTALKRVST